MAVFVGWAPDGALQPSRIGPQAQEQIPLVASTG
jgi:hypothetical protein